MAIGRPAGAGHVIYAEGAARLLDQGYVPIPIRPGKKVPGVSRWSTVDVGPDQVAKWARDFPRHGIGLRTGSLAGLDIDISNPDEAHQVCKSAQALFGATLMRVGRWPKRLLLYRTEAPFAKLKGREIEVLGAGQQFVAFGVHPDTAQPYSWPMGETPFDVALQDLPVVSRERMAAFVGETSAGLPPAGSGPRRPPGSAPAPSQPVRDASGRVVDGRDAWLSQIAFHAVHDALEAGQDLDTGRLADAVWARFGDTSSLDRPKSNGPRDYSQCDALRKVRDKLHLHAGGRLPERGCKTPEPEYFAPDLPVARARATLDASLSSACDRIRDWWRFDQTAPVPRMGIRATVGLGKSTAARKHIETLRQDLQKAGLPARIAVLTASQALAEETAIAWRQTGHSVAVLRGYEQRDPDTGRPMCRDIGAVRTALRARRDVASSVCWNAKGQACAHFDTCPKQRNRRDVAEADIVVAPYDVLFTSFRADHGGFGLLLIDEACWPRAVRETRGLFVETLMSDQLVVGGHHDQDVQTGPGLAAAMKALSAAGEGPVCRQHLEGAGLTGPDCQALAAGARKSRRDPGLYPGMPPNLRVRASEIAEHNAKASARAEMFDTMAEMLEREDVGGRLRVLPPDRCTGLHGIAVHGLARLHPALRNIPVLHLDATLRPEIAERVLPGLEVSQIEAAVPHMHVRLVTGRFGKSVLCSGRHPSGSSTELLAEAVDYVRWHALAKAPGRTLVITHKACERAFRDIPQVDTSHYNAVAGLDRWKDVRQIILVGRPLPGTGDLERLCGAVVGHNAEGSYHQEKVGVHMRDGSTSLVRVVRHSDAIAETLRAAICDDEMLQATGRGRGVNRTADTPLDLHILADVALPLVHDHVSTWEMEAPGLPQRMLLAGVAVDSPADAVLLHPQLLLNAEQAKKRFARELFKGQTPYISLIREMSLKSARYRRPGRGRSWQNAWWSTRLLQDAEAREVLETALGPLAGWEMHEP